MKICDIELLVVLLLWEIVFTMTADLEITRRKGRDSFKSRSPLLCVKFINCKIFHAEATKHADDCACLCPKNYSTFGFYNETWGCRESEKVRTLLGGDTGTYFQFKCEIKRKELRVLIICERRRFRLNHTMPNCTQDGGTRYFKCGDREDASPESNTFELIAEKNSYYIKVINTTSKDSLKGRIIKVKITCNDTRRGSTRSVALLFKFEGTINYTIQTPTLTTLPKASKVTKLSKARQNVSEAPSTTLEKRSTTTNSPSKSTVVARPDPNQEQRSGGKSSPLALIAGVSVSILVILILIALLIYRHRHSLERSNSGRESKEKRETVIRSLDEIRSDGPEYEDHYRTLTLEDSAVYASVPVRNGEAHQGNSRKNNDDEGHLYAPLSISGGQNIYGHRNSQETVAKDTRPNINDPISVNQCVYDLMEEILMEPLKGPAEGDENGTEPVYNVLEGSCLDGSQRPAFFGITSDSTEDLVYNYVDDGNHPMGNVSEGPSLNEAEESSHYAGTGPMEPFYNTLEANVNENDGDPVYNILEAIEDEGGPRHQSDMFTVEPIHPNLEKSKPNISDKANDLNITTEPVYDILEQDPI